MGQHPKQRQRNMKTLLLLGSLSLISADFPGGSHEHDHAGALGLSREGRQQGEAVQGGVDFSGCVTDPETGLCCVDKLSEVTSIEKEPILECTHKNTEQCHYTYVTQFQPSQEEVCEENFEKQCSITFKQKAFNETVKKCYKPVEKVCNGQGPEECHDKVLVSLVDVPEEVCDLNPQKTCRFI